MSPNTGRRTQRCIIDSLALAISLAWMNCWRAVFACRLRAQLAGAQDTSINAWRMSGYQSLLGATKLIVLPLSALIVFPLASVVAFYRYAAVLSCRRGLGFAEVIARASKLAGIERRQSWSALAAIAFLQLLVTLNVAIALAILPQMARMLTGYESTFSRAGLSYVTNPLFAMAALMIGWMAIDPFIQAVYCVMYFGRESLASGEDLRAGLRRLPGGLRRAAPAGTALLCIFAGSARRAWSASAVASEPLRQSIQQTMQAHEYDWRLPRAEAAQKPSWLLNMANQFFHGVAWTLDQIGRAIEDLIRWIMDKFSMPGEKRARPRLMRYR